MGNHIICRPVTIRIIKSAFFRLGSLEKDFHLKRIQKEKKRRKEKENLKFHFNDFGVFHHLLNESV